MLLTKNIKINNFKINKKKKKKNNLNNFSKQNWFKKIKLLKSLSNNYDYSYSKKDISKFKKNLNFRVIGMGGSILGTKAIYEFLSHKIKKKFIFIDNLKPKFFQSEKNFKSVNIIVSKSGNTIETVSNTNFLLNKNKKNKNIFIIENSDNYLFKVAQKIKAEIIEHKNYIGGRYSVLSEVGMLPAELMGLNEKKFKRYNNLIKNKNFIKKLLNNVEATLQLVKEGKYNSIILNYDLKSRNFLKWYQQLIAESLGKKSKGIIPIISEMPKDNHSVTQLYLDGPKKNFFTFFIANEKKSEKIVNKNLLKPYINLKNKSFYQILNSQKKATEIVFNKKKLPFRSFEIVKRSEETMGELFCFFILETILLGKALNVNPFDQPSVELIKSETKKFLF